VLLLTINPGWSGQKFACTARERLKQLRKKVGNQALICADGGVTRDNVAEVADLGADIIVAGSAIFDGRSPRENLQRMMSVIS
jgi:ribulose-phosphate 3-epimerase